MISKSSTFDGRPCAMELLLLFLTSLNDTFSDAWITQCQMGG